MVCLQHMVLPGLSRKQQEENRHDLTLHHNNEYVQQGSTCTEVTIWCFEHLGKRGPHLPTPCHVTRGKVSMRYEVVWATPPNVWPSVAEI